MIEIDTAMVIDQIDTDALQRELNRRRKQGRDDVVALCWLALEELWRGNPDEAELILERALRPAFPDKKTAIMRLHATMGSASRERE